MTEVNPGLTLEVPGRRKYRSVQGMQICRSHPFVHQHEKVYLIFYQEDKTVASARSQWTDSPSRRIRLRPQVVLLKGWRIPQTKP